MTEVEFSQLVETKIEEIRQNRASIREQFIRHWLALKLKPDELNKDFITKHIELVEKFDGNEVVFWIRVKDRPPRKKQPSTTFYCDARKKDLLKMLSEKTKTSMNDFLKEAIDLVLEKHKGELECQ